MKKMRYLILICCICQNINNSNLLSQVIDDIPDQRITRTGDEFYFASSVDHADVNGDGYSDLIVGSPSKGISDQGAVEVFFGSENGVSLIPDQIISGIHSSDLLGSSLARAGDVNNDGYEDIIATSLDYDNAGIFHDGAVFLWLGSPTGLNPSIATSLFGGQNYCNFGQSLHSAGDVNGDGFDDIIVGAPLYDNGQTDEGRAYVFAGNATGLSNIPLWTSEVNQDGSNFGYCVSGGKNVNGDGYDDIIVGAPYVSSYARGRVYVYHGSASGPSISYDWNFTGSMKYCNMGYSVDIAGDINSDGYDDVVVAALKFDTPADQAGKAYIFLGSTTGLSSDSAWTYYLNQVDGYLGYDVTGVGDVNGDNYDDFTVSSIFYSANNWFRSGCVLLFLGGEMPLSQNPIVTVLGNADYCSLAIASAAGDINNDGFDDFVLGNKNYVSPGGIGSADIYYGGDFINRTPDDTLLGNSSFKYWGKAVRNVGDINNDGYTDLIIGLNLFFGSTTGINHVPADTFNRPYGTGTFPDGLTTAGDINGDGFDDVLCGESSTHDAFIFTGSPEGLSETFFQAIHTPQAFAKWLGKPVGDVNGDGFDDILLGAYEYSSYKGIAVLYYGSASGLDSVWSIIGTNDDSDLGRKITALGDINSDGYDDFCVAESGYEYTPSYPKGRILIYYGTSTVPTNTPDFIINTKTYGTYSFGMNVLGDYDFNNDGFLDLIITKERYNYNFPGSVEVYFGNSEGTFDSIPFIYRDNQEVTHFGEEIAAGDFNGDSYDDFAVSGYLYSHPQISEGMAIVFNGNLFGINNYPSAYLETNQGGESFGTQLTSGDFNNDSFFEYVSSAPNFDKNYTNEGGIFLYTGKPSTCIMPEITSSTIGENSITVDFITGNPVSSVIRFKNETDTFYNYISTTVDSYTISGLTSCTEYEISIQANCIDGSSEWTDPLFLTTTGCPVCVEAPTGLFANNITTNSAKLHWDVYPEAIKFKIYYKPSTGGPWLKKNATSNSKTITGLSAGMLYYYKVMSFCDGGLSSPFSPVSTFTTLLKLGVENNYNVSIYPSPATTDIYINYPETNEQINISTYNLLGEQILINFDKNYHASINNLPNGIYITEIVSEDNKYFIKWVKE